MKRLRRFDPVIVLSTFLVGAPLTASAATQSQEPETKKEEEGKSSEMTAVETTEEKREGLDRKLDKTLSEFDALILREQEILEQRREAAGAAGGGAGAGTAGVAGEGGSGVEAAEGESGEEAGGETASGGKASTKGTGGSPDQPAGEPIPSSGEPGEPDENDESEGGGEVANGHRVPEDVGNGEDDDIVARQLREAAMKEEDPELREKLWDEYRAYKFGQKKPTKTNEPSEKETKP
jgi:hypothetical protein